MKTYLVDCYAEQNDGEPETTLALQASSPADAATIAANLGPWKRVEVRS